MVGEGVVCCVGVIGEGLVVVASFMLDEVEHLKSVESRCAFLE